MRPVRNVARLGEQTGVATKKVLETRAGVRDPVDIGRADLGIAVASRGPDTLVVGQNEHDIWIFRSHNPLPLPEIRERQRRFSARTKRRGPVG